MARYPVFDPALLGDLTLVDIPSAEEIIRDRMLRVKELWTFYDPPLGAVYDVEGTEFDPIKIIMEAATSFEINALSRINAFGEATTLAFGWGPNLDAIATRYPGGVPRQPGESDTRYRRRIWLSPNSLSSAGAQGTFEFWALTALAGARDVSEHIMRPSLRDPPTVVITVLMEGPDPIPSENDRFAVYAKLSEVMIKPMTDAISVVAPIVIDTAYDVDVWLYPAAPLEETMAAINAALAQRAADTYYLGEDQTRAGIVRVAKLAGVQNIIVNSPAEDIKVSLRSVGKVSRITATYKGRAE